MATDGNTNIQSGNEEQEEEKGCAEQFLTHAVRSGQWRVIILHFMGWLGHVGISRNQSKTQTINKDWILVYCGRISKPSIADGHQRS